MANFHAADANYILTTFVFVVMLCGRCAVCTSAISPQESSDVAAVFVARGGTERGSENAGCRRQLVGNSKLRKNPFTPSLSPHGRGERATNWRMHPKKRRAARLAYSPSRERRSSSCRISMSKQVGTSGKWLDDETRQDGQHLAMLAILSNTFKRYKTRMMANITNMANVFSAILN